jgi:hypothetical protein
MVSKAMLEELAIILKEDFSVELEQDDLEQLASFLIEYFDVLTKIDSGSSVRKSS